MAQNEWTAQIRIDRMRDFESSGLRFGFVDFAKLYSHCLFFPCSLCTLSARDVVPVKTHRKYLQREGYTEGLDPSSLLRTFAR